MEEVNLPLLSKWKQQKPPPRISSDQATAEIKCDQCEYVAAFEKGLRQHIQKEHKVLQPEMMRKPSFGHPLSAIQNFEPVPSGHFKHTYSEY